MKEIIVKIDENGNMTTEAQGFKGKACLTETMKLLEKLSKQQTSQHFKSEYNQIAQAERVAER